MPTTRALAAALAPDVVKRAHERWSLRRRAHAVSGPTRDFVARHGRTVLHGPLAGLRYPDDAADAGTDYLVAKLTGAYELELHDVIAEWVRAAPAHVVDVGSAEGYYAVGLARAIPGARVHAFDVDAGARDRCAALAGLNGVSDRVSVGEACTPEVLAALPEDGVVLLCDAEGYERELLDPARVPRLAGWPILVELHDFLDPSITPGIARRFAATHELRLIDERPRRGEDIPELRDLPAGQRDALLDEYRPARMQWGYLRPAARSAAASVSAA
jgi:hypothetical protein